MVTCHAFDFIISKGVIKWAITVMWLHEQYRCVAKWENVHLTFPPNDDVIPAVWSESSLSTRRNFVSFAIENVPCEDSDQTAWMRSLIWIFAMRTCPKICILTLGLKYFLPCILADITKTCLYNFDPLKPHFYIVKLGFTVVYIIFLFFSKT